MPNVFSHPCQLDESISNLRVVGWYFLIFIQNFKRNFCKYTVENLIRRRILRHLIWFCTVCRVPTKKTLGLYGLRILQNEMYFSSCWKAAKPNGLSYSRTSTFPILELLGVFFFIFSQILIEHSECKQWRSWSYIAWCDVWSGSALFAYVP